MQAGYPICKRTRHHSINLNYLSLFMKDKNISKLVKILAFIFLAYGSIQLIIGMKHIWWSLRFLFYPSGNALTESLYYFFRTIFFKMVIPCLAFISGIGLLKQKKWGWYCAFSAALIVFALNLVGTINFLVASYRYRNIPMPSVPEGSTVEYISMIPVYLYTIGGLIVIIILTRKACKQHLGLKKD